jgi:hypothetical protein
MFYTGYSSAAAHNKFDDIRDETLRNPACMFVIHRNMLT